MAFLRLELAELQHVLCGHGDLSEVWSRFAQAERRASRWWVWTGLYGHKLPQEWEDEISDLEVRFLLTANGSR